ncbi:hypothetical protein ABZW30_08075 [Kitasatospora sp. NPDC004669]|uniref:hypothetical protein n=1 Tax=Kitasatospora sp. NPDC004669 TaxID=3154555 RepID=UPI0033B249D8
MPTTDPDQLLAVTPIHLAGPGHEDVPWHLGAYFGWFHDTAGPDAILVSACERATLARSAAAPAGQGRLTLTVYDDQFGEPWSVSFDEQAPSEITASVLYAVAYGLDQWPGLVLYGEAGRQAAFDVLDRAGWSALTHDDHWVAVSPDRLASLAVPLAGSKDSVLSGSAGHGTWSITFSPTAPAFLSQRAAVALTRTAPVLRHARDLPAAHLPHLTTTAAPEPPRHGAVAPRYLAGRGADQRPPHLATERHWSHQRSDDGGIMTSPCGRLMVQYGDRDTPWPLLVDASPGRRRSPLDYGEWRAAFSPGTPHEIAEEFINAVADRLPAGTNHSAQVNTDSGLTLGEAIAPLTAAGWHTRLDRGTIALLSPDGHASAHIDHGCGPVHGLALAEILTQDRHFGASIDVSGAPAASWRAVLTGGAPVHLVQAMATAVANPRPVFRSALDLPSQFRSAATTATRHPERPASLAARMRTIPAQVTTFAHAPTTSTASPVPGRSGRSR